jgi:hypothetical protein
MEDVGRERTAPTPDALRQAVLMAAVLDDVDVTPADDGIVLDGMPPLALPWALLVEAMAGVDPVSSAGRAHLVAWLTLVRSLADLPHDHIVDRLRPVGLPPVHSLHPGAAWVRERVPGGLLDLGFGVTAIDAADPDAVLVLLPGALEAIGLEPARHWAAMKAYLERMGEVAALRLDRDPELPLRPMGDADVVTLLGSRALRSALAQADGVGMRGLAAPMRSRGWTDPDHVDSAFALAALAATSDVEQGLPCAVLVTDDGLYRSIGGHVPSDFVLREARSPRRGRHRRTEPLPVRYRAT